jgi:hypothetical protein
MAQISHFRRTGTVWILDTERLKSNRRSVTREPYASGLGCGVVFKLAPNSKGGWSESVLHRFLDNRGTGAHPYAGLIFDATGNLYGTTGGDFKKTHGSVFEITP